MIYVHVLEWVKYEWVKKKVIPASSVEEAYRIRRKLLKRNPNIGVVII